MVENLLARVPETDPALEPSRDSGKESPTTAAEVPVELKEPEVPKLPQASVAAAPAAAASSSSSTDAMLQKGEEKLDSWLGSFRAAKEAGLTALKGRRKQ